MVVKQYCTLFICAARLALLKCYSVIAVNDIVMPWACIITVFQSYCAYLVAVFKFFCACVVEVLHHCRACVV